MNRENFCPGSDDPQVCLNCKRARCILDMSARSPSREKNLVPKKRYESKPKEAAKVFGRHLAAEVKHNGLTVKQLMEYTGASHSAVYRWMRGDAMPHERMKRKLVELMPNMMEVSNE